MSGDIDDITKIHEYGWTDKLHKDSMTSDIETLLASDAAYNDDGHVIIDMNNMTEDVLDESLMADELLHGMPKQCLGHIAYVARQMDEYRDEAMVRIEGQTELVPTRDLSEIGVDERGQLVNIECRVQDVKKDRTNKFTNKWKCQKGHITYNGTERWRAESDAPASCSGRTDYDSDADEADDCGLSPYKKIPNEGYGNTVQQLVVGELDVDDRNSRSVIGEVDWHMVDEVERRDKVNLWAIVMVADDASNKVDNYLHIVGIESRENEIELDEQTVERLEQKAEESDDIVQDLADSVAPELVPKIGHDIARKAVLCSIARGHNNAVGDRNTINTLLYGLPGSGKSKILEHADELSVISKLVDASQVSKPGLTASASKDEIIQNDESWVLTPGAIPQADGGIVCIDELDKGEWAMKEALNTPMESQVVNVEKAAEGDLSADVSFVAAANPGDESYGGVAPILSLDLPSSSQDRFDLIIRVDDEVQDKEKEMEIQKEIRRRKREGVNPPFDTRELKEYLAYARSLEVEMSEKADEAIVERIVQLRMLADDIEMEGVRVTGREEGQLARAAAAMCKLRLGNVVTVTDVKRAWKLMKESWQGLTQDSFRFADDEDYLVAISITNPSQQQVYEQTVDVLGMAEGAESELLVDVVYESVDGSEESVDWVLSSLEDKGHVRVSDESVDVIDLPT